MIFHYLYSMKNYILKSLFSLFIAFFTISAYSQESQRNFSFAWLSDTHLGSFAYAREDLITILKEASENDSIAFVVVSGDLTEFGTTEEFADYASIIKGCSKPVYLANGNHDVNWSENGCTAYEKYLGDTHFVFDYQGIRFIGCGAGPMLRMGPPHTPREEIEWLKSVTDTTAADIPVIFINHCPMDGGVSNSIEFTDILKKVSLQGILCGHEHRNTVKNYNGAKSIVGRSILKRKDPAGGYNIVSIKNDSIKISEKIIGGGLSSWYGEKITQKAFPIENETISYEINNKYPNVKQIWRIAEDADIAAQCSVDGNLFVYATTAGKVVAINALTGKKKWEFQTGNKGFSSPLITIDRVFITSCNGIIYCFTSA